MRLPDEQEERGFSAPVIYTIVTVSVLVLIILVIVYVSNNQKPSGRKIATLTATASPEIADESDEIIFSEGNKDIETLYKENKLRAEDLDFWDMYEKNDAIALVTPSASPSPTATPELTDEQKAEDGKHTVAAYLASVNKALTIAKFVRFEVGEGMEKKNDDFAAVVAAQAGL